MDKKEFETQEFKDLEINEEKDVIISSLISYESTVECVDNLKFASNFMSVCPIADFEDILKIAMPLMVQILDEMIEKNVSNKSESTEFLKENLQTCITILNACSEVVGHLSKENINWVHVQSVPMNVLQILTISFEHCKNGETVYAIHFKSINEIFELFRITQDLHLKFVTFLEKILFEDCEIVNLINILNDLCQLSYVLSGLNTKSMVDNWKGFTAITQKYSNGLKRSLYNLSIPIKVLTANIKNYRNKIFMADDEKSILQNCKLMIFLHKLTLKLFDMFWESVELLHEDIIKYFIVSNSVGTDYFQFHQYSPEVLDIINRLTECNIDLIKFEMLMENENFIKYFLALPSDPAFCNDWEIISCEYAILISINYIMSLTSELQLQKFPIVDILQLTLNCINKSFTELCIDSSLWEKLITNTAISILLNSNSYHKIEELLLKSLMQHNIWAAIFASDLWSAVLCNSVKTAHKTLETLLVKILELNQQTSTNECPELIFLKIFTNRLYSSLPYTEKLAILSKFKPTSINLRIVPYLNINNIPLSQRFYIEDLLSDLNDKINIIDEWNINDFIMALNLLDIISELNFNTFQLNSSKIVTIIERLWAFNSCDFELNRSFYVFLIKLCNLTKTVIYQIDGDTLYLILNQLKQMLHEPIIKILFCEFLKTMESHHLDNFKLKISIFTVIAQMISILSNDQNPIIVSNAIELYEHYSKNENFKLIVRKNNYNKLDSFLRNTEEISNEIFKGYLDQISSVTFQHECYKNENLAPPQLKKMKIEENSEKIIIELRNRLKKLKNMVGSSGRLNPQHYGAVEGIINDLEQII